MKDKAAAHARLAEVYTESGKKVEADENVKDGEAYLRQAVDKKKAAALDQKIKVKNQ